MTREECAEALWDLIVVRGRRHGREDAIFGNDFGALPEFMRDIWLLKADEFQALNNFQFTEG